MARKNRKSKYRKMHQAMVKDYEDYAKKLEVKRERRKEKNEKSFKEKMEERMEQKGRLQAKHTDPVIGSKIKRDKLAEQFKQMKISRLKLMDKQQATLESMQEGKDDSDDSEDEMKEDEEVKIEDQEMKVQKIKSKKNSRAYKKMMKSVMKKASKRPILVRRKMEVD